MTALLMASKLEFGYSGRPVLRDINFVVQPGEMVALLGANGAGKTTLLKLVTGLLQPQQGEVRLHDRRIKEYSRRELARRIALVPQEVSISFEFTVQELVEQGRTPYLSMLGNMAASDDASVQQAMELARVDHLASRSFNELSGGERQRVKIALALAQGPELLLLDEPAQHLDIGRHAEIFALLQELNRRGTTIIGAVHDLQSALDYFPATLMLLPDHAPIFGPTPEVLSETNISLAYGVNWRAARSPDHARLAATKEGP